MTLKQKSIKGFFWDFAGRLGMQGVGFIVSIVLARILAPEDFGVLAIITVFINLASVFLDLGFSTALVQRSDVKGEHYTAVFYINVIMGFFLASIVFFLAPIIGNFYNNETLVNLTRFMSLSFIINSFGNVIRAKLRREMDFKIVSIINIFSAFISGFLAMLMAWKGFGVWSLAIQTILNQLISNLLIFYLRPMKLSLQFSYLALKDLWGFSSKLFFSGLLDTLFINLDSLLIGKILSPATLGYYYRAKSLENFTFSYTSSTISSVLLSGLSSLQNETERLKTVVFKTFLILTFISFLVSGLLYISSSEIIILLFSIKWKSSIIMFKIIVLGAFATQISSLFYNVLLSTGNINTYVKINILSKSLMTLNFIILFLYGIKIYLIVFSIVRVIIFCYSIIRVSRILDYNKTLYLKAIRYFVNFIFTIICTLELKRLYSDLNYYLVICINTLIFISLYMFFEYILLKNEGTKLLLIEIKSYFKN